MKIAQTRSNLPANRRRKAGSDGAAASSDRFASHFQADSAAASRPAAAAPLAALSSLLSIQEVSDMADDRRRAVLHGNDLLDELRDLQIGLVQGSIPEELLRGIARLLDRPRPAIDDPALNQILGEIEVRAAVELAKLERGPA